MNVYYLGRENQPGVKKYIDFYFVEKRTGKFLVKKHSNRTTEKYALHRNGMHLITTSVDTEVEYTNTISDVIRSEVVNTVIILEHINKKFFNVVPLTETVKVEGIVTYTTKTNTKLEGTLPAIFAICKQIGETVDVSKLSGFDKTKYYYSASKEEWIAIKEMNSMHIMNSVAKKIRDYFDVLAVKKTDSVPEFLSKLELWTEDQTIKGLVEELAVRV